MADYDKPATFGGAKVVFPQSPTSPKHDPVVLPEHYARYKIEPVKFIVENGLPFAVGNIIKYVMRWDAKDGLQDLKKAQRYIDMLVSYVEGHKDWWTSASSKHRAAVMDNLEATFSSVDHASPDEQPDWREPRMGFVDFDVLEGQIID